MEPLIVWTVVVGGLLLALQVGYILSKRTSRFSPPVMMIAGIYAVFALVGPALFTLFDLPHQDIEEDVFSTRLHVWITSGALLLASLSLIVGNLAAASALSPSGQRSGGAAQELRGLILGVPRSWLFGVGAAPLLLYWGGRGPQNLIVSQAYLYSTGPEDLEKLGFALSPVGMLAAGVLVARQPHGEPHVERRQVQYSALLGTLVVGLYAATFFAASSRSLALLPLIVGLTSIAIRPCAPTLRVLLTVVLTLYGLSVPLHTRGLGTHGLVPYISSFLHEPAAFFTIDFPSLLENLLFGYPLTNYTATLPMPVGSLAASLSPLPADLSGFNDLSSSLRVNYYVPYSAIGELLSHGLVVLVLYFVAVGVLVATTWTVCSRLPSQWAALLKVPIIGGALLFAVQSLQYNLRTVTRIEYYVLVAVLGLAAIVALLRDQKASAHV